MEVIFKNAKLVFRHAEYDEYESESITPQSGETIDVQVSFGKEYPHDSLIKVYAETSNGDAPVDDTNGIGVYNYLGQADSITPNKINEYNQWVSFSNNTFLTGMRFVRNSHIVAGVTTKFHIRVFK